MNEHLYFQYLWQFEIVTNEYTEPYAKVSEAELRSIDEGLEEAKKGVFIPHNEVMKGLRELIEKEA